MSGTVAAKQFVRGSSVNGGNLVRANDITQTANYLQQSGLGLFADGKQENFHIRMAARMARDPRMQDLYSEHLYDNIHGARVTGELPDPEESARKRSTIYKWIEEAEQSIGESKVIQEEIRLLRNEDDGKEANPQIQLDEIVQDAAPSVEKEPLYVTQAVGLVEALQNALRSMKSFDVRVKENISKVPSAIMNMMLSLISQIWGKKKSGSTGSVTDLKNNKSSDYVEFESFPGMRNIVINLATFIITLSLVKRFADAEGMDRIEGALQSYIATRARPATKEEKELSLL